MIITKQKEFIELHKGEIEVSSSKGTEFIITLYKDNVHLSTDEIVYEPAIIDNPLLNFNLDYEDDAFTVQNDLIEENRDSILLIEDNEDLVKYLSSKLKLEYNVSINNGNNVLEKAFEVMPDIIICDVNLPEKNGFEICDILKKDIRTSHIPVIILTAYDSKESYIQGLESGADLFLTKPFSFAILYRSIKNLLYNREKLRKHYIKNIYKSEPIKKIGLFEQDLILETRLFVSVNADRYLKENYKPSELPAYEVLRGTKNKDNKYKSLIYLKLTKGEMIEGSHSCYLRIFSPFTTKIPVTDYNHSNFTYTTLTSEVDKLVEYMFLPIRHKITHNPELTWQRKAILALKDLGIRVHPEDVLTSKDQKAFKRKFGVM